MIYVVVHNHTPFKCLLGIHVLSIHWVIYSDFSISRKVNGYKASTFLIQYIEAVLQSVQQGIHVTLTVEDAKASSGGSIQIKDCMKGLRTVVTTSQSHSMSVVHDLANVMRMCPLTAKEIRGNRFSPLGGPRI